jgi:MFS family permease
MREANPGTLDSAHKVRRWRILAIAAYCQADERLGIAFTIIFFIASSAASAAYLTVSEIFPLEIRAFAIAILYALGTLIGGVGAPVLFGFLIAANSRPAVAGGYALGALLMLRASRASTLSVSKLPAGASNLSQSRCKVPDSLSPS